MLSHSLISIVWKNAVKTSPENLHTRFGIRIISWLETQFLNPCRKKHNLDDRHYKDLAKMKEKRTETSKELIQNANEVSKRQAPIAYKTCSIQKSFNWYRRAQFNIQKMVEWNSSTFNLVKLSKMCAIHSLVSEYSVNGEVPFWCKTILIVITRLVNRLI